MTSYRPMTLADLGRRLARVDDAKTRWKLVWEFLEEYRWEPDGVQLSPLRDEPAVTGDERWDVLLAALAEHLAAQHDQAAPEWTEIRVLQRPWFPENWKPSEPMRWSGHRPRFASTACICQPGTWRRRDRAG